ncbi:rab-GTPase-TBC domain-containing protein [Exophiala viscosa]|uniref:GTPase-activating protein GYP5 n=1 Tax=Exophiala viscosa TaxID=2486360 RepID=A0AAN6DW55_9EURO|nr:rab-GTPase-TBC domain-containing protein [Exophiala viscosa]
METVQSSADNTDLEEKFEDANDTNDDSQRNSSHEDQLQTNPESHEPRPAPEHETPEHETPEHETPEHERPSIPEPEPEPEPDPEQHHENTSSLEQRKSDENADPSSGDESTPKASPEGQQIPTLNAPESSDDHVEPDKIDQPKAPRGRFQGFSAALPSVPWGAPPARKASDARAPSPQPPAPTSGFGRKVTTPFGWLSRATSAPKETRSPPLPSRTQADARRNTAASLSTLGSNPDLTLKALDETQDTQNGSKQPSRASLREQFKMLRLREEAGITSLEGTESAEGGAIAGLIGRSASLGVGIATPGSVGPDEKVMTTPVLSPTSPTSESIPINPNLAPGTVAGVAASAADTATPIDWDFWQNVVNEGPQAVARTSPDEFTQAISGGIPQTIRPVIWQVLAGSKNEDLEAVYWDLRNRGTNGEVKEPPPKSPLLNGHANGSVKEKESVSSSRSSIRSDHSTPATSANVGLASPSPSQEQTDPMAAARLQTQLAAEKAKKAKEDSAAMSKLEKMIKRDMGSRTSYSKYAAAAGLQDGLFHVCRAYALFDDAVGYPQGMNFIVMPLLFTMPEEEAFCLLVRLMNKYQLRELFIQDMPGLHLHLYQFERLLEDLEPALYCHLNRRQVTPKLYATQWFLTLFAYRFPLQLVMRVFDLILCEGLEGAILKFGMAVIQRNVQTLLAMQDMQALTNFLKEKVFDVYMDATPSSKSLLESGFFGSSGGSDTEVYRADLLVQDACAVKLTPEMLNRYREEYETSTKAEKARETELENLKTDCATKASQIRSLENRAQQSDTEHIEIANELVRLKVENSELQDRNESLSVQVEELRKVAESEATNVEERMRAGTEQVMQRNIEVQNQNRHMEEQMAEMEKELVEMKLKYAEVSFAGFQILKANC